MVELWPHQEKALRRLRPGRILAGGVGSGKSLTALVWWLQEYPERDLVIITPAVKRDSLEWDGELAAVGKKHTDHIFVDSWNNIGKYADKTNCLFLFDEQRLTGNGAWVKHFLKIAKSNAWIVLSGTPGDTWMDYVPVFLANGFYKNRTEFYYNHVIFDRYAKYPKVQRYIGEKKLDAMRASVLVEMKMERHTTRHISKVYVDYDKELYSIGTSTRFDPWEKKPFKNAGALCYFQRKVSNMGSDRYRACRALCEKHPKVIIFYSFNYELEMLLELERDLKRPVWQRNGFKHERIDDSFDEWVYLVQYASGSEAWNCISTDATIFYSQTYSWRQREQSMGRIDRGNTPFKDLYYYELTTNSSIDRAIRKALETKKEFNEKAYTQGFYG